MITRSDLARVVDHCSASLPNEACGILGGRDGRVWNVYCMRNTRPGPASYEMDPEEQFRVMKDVREQGLAMVGIFHSHPVSPAFPSGIDVERAYWPGTLFPNYPEALYVIVSLRDPDVPDIRAFTIREGKINEALLQIA